MVLMVPLVLMAVLATSIDGSASIDGGADIDGYIGITCPNEPLLLLLQSEKIDQKHQLQNIFNFNYSPIEGSVSKRGRGFTSAVCSLTCCLSPSLVLKQNLY